jgi:hypothetical protein
MEDEDDDAEMADYGTDFSDDVDPKSGIGSLVFPGFLSCRDLNGPAGGEGGDPRLFGRETGKPRFPIRPRAGGPGTTSRVRELPVVPPPEPETKCHTGRSPRRARAHRSMFSAELRSRTRLAGVV